ncbi:MAG TPA: MBL fold metallo-hydrolase [Steroidobacteraceae bacterium]|jgi:glyoxylase-like metal-dependent hydrolase (beta-lactamase superfamily II)|nr:MBL fold metallo-hydrolase [Steroidobacteraceae bacterium]
MKNNGTLVLARIALAALIALAMPAAQAAAPAVKTQAPGFYRTLLGDFEVTTILDGMLMLDPVQLLTNTQPEHVTEMLAKQFLASPVETSVNTFLINTGSKLVLVDTGAGSLFGPTTGKFLANLKAAGYTPDEVDDVVVTHMHGDHVGGLTTNGKRTFPNAVVHADKRDADYWLSKAEMDKAPAAAKGGFQGAMASFQPYIDAKKFQPFEAGATIVPGIKSAPAHGHTPGHTIYIVESRGQKLVLWGDLLHVAAVQFAEPAVTIRFDSDSKSAAAARAKALQEAAEGRYLVGIAHVSFPGLGHIRRDGNGYAWLPVNYSTLLQPVGPPIGR